MGNYENLQGFFESTVGQITSVAVLILLFLGVIISGKGKTTNVKTVVASALLVALSIVLNQITLWQMPQGGSVSVFGMLPIVLCAYFFGTRRAVMAGMCVGMIDLIFKPYIVHPVQLLLDYPLAYGAVGFAGLIFLLKKDGLIPAYLFGVFCRYICAVLSGIIFFAAYAPEGFNAFTWSIYYNMTYLAVEALLTVIVLAIPAVRRAFAQIKRSLA